MRDPGQPVNVFAGVHAARNASLLAVLLDGRCGITCSEAVRDGVLGMPLVEQKEADELAAALGEVIMSGDATDEVIQGLVPRACGFAPAAAFPH